MPELPGGDLDTDRGKSSVYKTQQEAVEGRTQSDTRFHDNERYDTTPGKELTSTLARRSAVSDEPKPKYIMIWDGCLGSGQKKMSYEELPDFLRERERKGERHTTIHVMRNSNRLPRDERLVRHDPLHSRKNPGAK